MNNSVNQPKTQNDLNRFIHETQKSFIRQSGFEISIVPPRILTSVGKPFDKIEFKAFSINTPATQLATADDYVEVNEYRKYAYDYSRGIVSVSFYVDGDYEIVRLFEGWKNSIFSPRSRAVTYYDEYVTYMFVNVLRKDNTIASKYIFHELFPKVINEISYDWSQNQTSVITITFEYAYYDLIDSSEPETQKTMEGISTFDPNTVGINNYLDFGLLSTDAISEPPGAEVGGFSTAEAAEIAEIEQVGEDASDANAEALDEATKMPAEIAAAEETDSQEVLDSAASSVEKAADAQEVVGMQVAMAAKSVELVTSKDAVEEAAKGIEETASQTKEAAKELKKKDFDKAESKFADALNTISGVVEKVENAKQIAESKIKTFANALDEVNKIANVLDTVQGIKDSVKDFRRLSKLIKAKNKFQAISAAKGAISAMSRTSRGSSKITKDVLGSVKSLSKLF